MVFALLIVFITQFELVAHQCDNNLFKIFELKNADWGFLRYVDGTYNGQYASPVYHISINRYHSCPLIRLVIKSAPKEVWLRLLINIEYRESACLWLMFLSRKNARMLEIVHDDKENRNWYIRNETIYWIKRLI